MSAEVFAVLKALKWILDHRVCKPTVILVDSLAALQSLKGTNSKCKGKYLVYECWKVLEQLQERRCSIIFQWIPSHSGIKGNERADSVAKASLHIDNIEPLMISLSDMYNLANTQVKKCLENDWSRIKDGFFLGSIKEKWEYWPCTEISNRHLEVAMARLRLGCTRLNYHMHKIGLADSPDCSYCRQPETIDHFLLHCHKLYSIRTELKDQLRKI